METERIKYNGWQNCMRLSNKEVELIVTADVGPRIIRFAFVGERNVLGEIADQAGGTGETEWMIRGGHRLWIAPEEKPKSYELDNTAISIEEIPCGIRTTQEPGNLTHVEKSMEINLASDTNDVTLKHVLTNRGKTSITLAPWALTVMALRGTAIIPMPKHVPHTDRLTHNQEWSLWGYTDLSDPRWKLGPKYIMFRQDPTKGPNKLGIAHREGWVAYLLDEFAFIKRYVHVERAQYPDGGVSFETFSNEEILELESIGPLTTLKHGQSVRHEERWSLHRHIPVCGTEAEIDSHVLPLA
ncbi:MAG: hypothetical protein E4H02_00035 [Lentisphaerales bacterium]|jgi:hypothetical protein|nr:MAG: hypothetical protein E4H02_00035 [Lentisphaerales bacterium]